MKAYTVHQFYVCEITGRVLAEISFQQEKEFKSFLHPFDNATNAKAYIEREARDWFLFCLEKFISHKKQVIKSSVAPTPAVLDSLKLCCDALVAYETKSLENICTYFIKGARHFEAILPNANNNSHQSSITNLHELTAFCTTWINNIHPKLIVKENGK